MKNKIVIVIGLLLCISSCRLPSSPLGEIKIIKRLETINTGGNCLDIDIDMDIGDSILVAAANYNGYFVYDIYSNNDGMIENIIKRTHISNFYEMDDNAGDNRAQSVVLSKNYNYAFILNNEDSLWMYNYGQDISEHIDYINGNFAGCGYGNWTNFTVDDNPEGISIYAIVKHQSGSSSGYWLENSKSLVYKAIGNIAEYNSITDSNNENSGCQYIVNQPYTTDEIYYSDNFLTVAYGELGVKIFNFSTTSQDTCIGTDNIGDLIGVSVNDENCLVQVNENNLFPTMVAKFDVPGEVETLYSIGRLIFTGLSKSNGVIISKINDDSSIADLQQFAIGYTIKGIHQDGDLLALAAGHDGILLYDSNEGNISFIGKVETSFANSVKVAGKIIFAATEDGIEIIQIDY